MVRDGEVDNRVLGSNSVFFHLMFRSFIGRKQQFEDFSEVNLFVQSVGGIQLHADSIIRVFEVLRDVSIAHQRE